MDLETAQTTTTAKLPILKQGEYDMWRLRIEQYFQVQDYALWDVIENGNSFKPVAQTTTIVNGTLTSLIPGPVTTEEKAQKNNDVKVRMGRDKVRAAAKNKGLKASGSSTMNDDALARLMVTEMTAQEKEEHLAFIKIKRREVECREREVAAQEYRARQEDIRFYLPPYGHLTGDHRMAMDEARATIKAKYNLQY
ncbi:hypothetical protein Tco_1476142 [Tanacetum coccineum]